MLTKLNFILVVLIGLNAQAAPIEFASPNPKSFKEVLIDLQKRQKMSPSIQSTAVPGNLKPKFPNQGTKGITNSSMGGSSDGGGNSVGNTLFDFYEQDGATEITLNDLRRMSPVFERKFQELNSYVHQRGDKVYHLGDWLAQGLSKKHLVLDLKKINSESCLNHSLVSSAHQEVVACQDDIEVRFYLPWLADPKTSAENQAGLFMHEALLAWARSLNTGDNKMLLEKKVRMLNRDIFNESNQKAITESILELFRVDFMSIQKAEAIHRIDEEVRHELSQFCTRPNLRLFIVLEELNQKNTVGYSAEVSTANTFLSLLPNLMKQKAADLRVNIRPIASRSELRKVIATDGLSREELAVILNLCEETLGSN